MCPKHETGYPGDDIDLAGDFELFRGPQVDQVRITEGLYPRTSSLSSR